jgi:aminomethyltransferase
MEGEIKKTLLNAWHRRHGANLSPFGGYEMPLWYDAGAKKEHLAVLTGAGLFDTSHMAVLSVRGSGAFDLLQHCFSRDLNACAGKPAGPLVPGRCAYGVFLLENGGCLDDALVYCMGEKDYLIVVNAGMGAAVARHLDGYAGDRFRVEIRDHTDRVGKIDLQGPLSVAILVKVLAEAREILRGMEYFSFKGHFLPESRVRLADGTPILLSRTGYTGELGFEIFVEPGALVSLWDKILDAGKELGILPCGLAARDSLRTGAGLPLSHQDIGPWPFICHPWHVALPFGRKGAGFTKDFVGSRALVEVENPECTLAFAGFDLRKVSAAEPAAVLDGEGKTIGRVLSCVTDMGIGRVDGRITSISSPGRPEGFTPAGLSCGFVRVARHLETGTRVTLADGRRKIPVEIVKEIRPDRTARMDIGQAIAG